MPHHVLFSAQAQADFDELYAFIADRAGEATAEAYMARLDDYVRAFGQFPERGTDTTTFGLGCASRASNVACRLPSRYGTVP